MQINDLRVEKFNKIANLAQLSSSQILSNFTIFQKIDYAKNINCFKASDRNGHNYQIYITKIQPNHDINQIVYLKDCPKILYLKGQSQSLIPQSLIIQENVFNRLTEYLIYHQANSVPYVQQIEAKKIIEQITQSLQNYLQHNIQYDSISPSNAMMTENGRWQLSVVGLLLGVDKDSSQYSTKQITKIENKITFALGCLFFKLVFGFSPIVASSNKFDDFSFKNYLKKLQIQQTKKMLKVYHFSQRTLQLSPECQKLLQNSLSGNMKIEQWLNHFYFKTPLTHVSHVNNKNKQIMMINSVDPSYYSLVMSAIDYKKNHPFEKFNQKSVPSPDQQTLSQAISSMQKHSLFRKFAFGQNILDKQSRVKASSNAVEESGPIASQYFYNQWFDPQHDYPCRELIKLLQSQSQNEEAKIKLYAYPYAVAYELLKVQKEQSIQWQRKIKKAVQLLMQVSAINYAGNVKPLHRVQQKFRSFEQVKPTFRESINELYTYFLNQAMRKYNCKNDTLSMIDKSKKKQKGLEYYRLCLKLLQASLINRKGGYDLNLPRIQTSQRKQIEKDLEDLLAKYFPRKPQIN